MSQAAQAVTAEVAKMRGSRKPRAEQKAKAERKPRERKAKAQKEPKVRDYMVGLKARPKGKNLFVNTPGALSVMYKGLKSLLSTGGLEDSEKADAKRLVARLESRGVN